MRRLIWRAGAMCSWLADHSQSPAATVSRPDLTSDLTPREHEILELIGQDFSNQGIAAQLTIEVGTVKNPVHNILEKLNVSSRRDAANFLAQLQ
jgi:two-component system, NarL family, nitrate/nitrite response regulator NarL